MLMISVAILCACCCVSSTPANAAALLPAPSTEPRACPSYQPQLTPIVASPKYVPRYRTIAHEFLDAERDAQEEKAPPMSPSMYALLDSVIDDAQQRLPVMRDDLTPSTYGQFATTVLTGIDCILLSRGFVYPARGWVQLLRDGVAPSYYPSADFVARASHNSSRRRFIEPRGQGPYYVVDCDIASYLYLGIADVMHYPLRMTELPTHNYIRWHHTDDTYIDFETMDGIVTGDDYYRNGFENVPNPAHPERVMPSLTRVQVVSYHVGSIATVYQWLRQYDKMLSAFNESLRLDSNERTTLNNLAWFYAAVPETMYRDGSKAVAYALRAVEQEPSGNTYDTLACAYAQAGQFALATTTENKAAKLPGLFLSHPEEHLRRFAASLPCDDPTFNKDVLNFHDALVSSDTRLRGNT